MLATYNAIFISDPPGTNWEQLSMDITSIQFPSFQICIGLLEEPKSFPVSSKIPKREVHNNKF